MTENAWIKIDQRKRFWPLKFYFFLYFNQRKMEATVERILGDSMLISRSEVARKISEGKIIKGSQVNLRGQSYIFVASVYPEKVFPECLLFYDPKEDQLFRFANAIKGQRI